MLIDDRPVSLEELAGCLGAPLKAALEEAEAKRKLAEIEDGKPYPLTILATEGGTAWAE